MPEYAACGVDLLLGAAQCAVLRRYETILLPAFEELVVHTQVSDQVVGSCRQTRPCALVATAQCEAAALAVSPPLCG